MAQKYAQFNQDGFPIGFYDDGIHKDIPKKSVKITNEQWQEFLDNQGQRIWQDGAVVEYVEPQHVIDERNRLNRIQEIKKLLREIDMQTIRPLRAGETDKVAELEEEAETLRTELQGLQA